MHRILRMVLRNIGRVPCSAYQGIKTAEIAGMVQARIQSAITANT